LVSLIPLGRPPFDNVFQIMSENLSSLFLEQTGLSTAGALLPSRTSPLQDQRFPYAN